MNLGKICASWGCSEDWKDGEQTPMDPTNDPALRSFIPVTPESHFPIQNLPYGVFRRGSGDPRHIGVAIGESVLNLAELEERGLLNGPALRGRRVLRQPT